MNITERLNQGRTAAAAATYSTARAVIILCNKVTTYNITQNKQ